MSLCHWIFPLVPDCGDSCNGRCMEEHTKTQHIYVVQLLMKKCLKKMKEHTSESRLSNDSFPTLWTGLIISWPNEAGLTKYHWWDCNYTVNRRLSNIKLKEEQQVDKKKVNQSLTYSLMCSFIFTGISSSEYYLDVLSFCVFLYASPIDFTI